MIKIELIRYSSSQWLSGVTRNFRQGVRQSVAFFPIHPCLAALPSRPYNQKNVMI